jgi:hypothetical protein
MCRWSLTHLCKNRTTKGVWLPKFQSKLTAEYLLFWLMSTQLSLRTVVHKSFFPYESQGTILTLRLKYAVGAEYKR